MSHELLADLLDSRNAEIDRLRRLLSADHASDCAALTQDVPCSCGWNSEEGQSGAVPETTGASDSEHTKGLAPPGAESADIGKLDSADKGITVCFHRHTTSTYNKQGVESMTCKDCGKRFRGEMG